MGQVAANGLDVDVAARPRHTMIPRILLALALAVALPALALEPPRLDFEAPPELAGRARELAALDPGPLLTVMELVGLEEPGPPVTVVLAPEGSPAATSAPRWVSGYAYGALGRVVLLPGRVPTYPDGSLAELLHHELAHVLVARAAGGGALPRWFSEGLAMTAAGDWSFGDRSRLTLAFLADRPISVATLEASFREGRGSVSRAYAVSAALVRELLRRHGRGSAAEILAAVARGAPFDDAFRRTTGESPEDAAAALADRMSFFYRWIPFLTSSATLWIAVTVLALLAIVARRRRDAALEERWEEEERWGTEEPWEEGREGEGTTVH